MNLTMLHHPLLKSKLPSLLKQYLLTATQHQIQNTNDKYEHIYMIRNSYDQNTKYTQEY